MLVPLLLATTPPHVPFVAALLVTVVFVRMTVPPVLKTPPPFVFVVLALNVLFVTVAIPPLL